MPTRNQTLAFAAATAALAAMGALAATLNVMETTAGNATDGASVSRTVTNVTVFWDTRYDADFGGQRVVGAKLQPLAGDISSSSTVDLTISGPLGAPLGRISSYDGGATWTSLPIPVAATDALGASVVINDDEMTVAVSVD
jgi:hypothetical protein